MNNNQLVAYYLMSSYLYYQKNEQVLSDKEFDDVCKLLLEKWEEIDHPHKKYIKKENLVAQTGYNIEFPNIVKMSAIGWKKPKTMSNFFKS